MKKYPTYKDSGLAWLGDIPTHWERKTIRAITKVRTERNQSELPLLSVYRDYGVILKDSRNDNHNRAGDDLTTYKVVRRGDLVINKMKTWQGSLGVSEYDGIVSPAYIVCSLDNQLNPRFVHYLLRSHRYIFAYNQISYGVRVDQWDMRYEDFKEIPIFIPSLEEQGAIVKYLDSKLEEIAIFISNKQKLIKLLKEQKAVIINRAVTRGVNSDIKFKPSGIHRLGDIPEHWNLKRLKYLMDMQGGYAFNSAHFTDPGVQLIKIGNLYQNELHLERQPTFLPNRFLELYAPFVVTKGDILMSLTGTLGKRDYGFAILLEEDTEFLLNQRVGKLTPSKELLTEYALHLLHSEMYLNQLFLLPYGTKQGNLSESQVLLSYVAYPAKKEQEQILELIKYESAKIEESIAKVEREIELIKEYKTALISEVVMGKIDIRVEKAQVKPGLIAKTKQVPPAFKRAVLAAEIVYQLHAEWTFGRVKLQKLLYLCEYHAELPEIESDYTKAAAGPFDSKLIHSVESQLLKAKWFKTIEVKENGKIVGHKYRPLEKVGSHKDYFERYWGAKRNSIQRIINLLRNEKTKHCEIVATLYAAWNDLLLRDKEVRDETILFEVLTNWHDEKRKIPEYRWREGLVWLRANKVIPTGFGKPTHHKKNKHLRVVQ